MAGTATWTAPVDWVDLDTVEAADLNTQLRDNLLYLKAYGADGGVTPFFLMGA